MILHNNTFIDRYRNIDVGQHDNNHCNQYEEEKTFQSGSTRPWKATCRWTIDEYIERKCKL